MAYKLPNELIKKILEPVLDIPDDLFHDVSDRPPFGRLDHVSAIPLTICKSWMPVVIMLLYRVVIIRSKAQAYALERILQANPYLGSYARKLRIEGGFGGLMSKIILLSPNLRSIYPTGTARKAYVLPQPLARHASPFGNRRGLGQVQ